MSVSQHADERIIKNADRPELAEELEARFCSTDPIIARRFAEEIFFARRC